MKKLSGYLMAIIAGLLVFGAYAAFSLSKLEKNLPLLNYVNSDEVTRNFAIMKKVVAQKNNILVLGGNDLKRYNEKSYPSDVFNYGNANFNFTLLGNEKDRSLSSLISLGALEPYYKDDKVAIIINSSWFTKNGVMESFATTFNPQIYREFLNNPKISKSLKNQITDRIKFYLKDNPISLAKIDELYNEKMYERIHFSEDLAGYTRNTFEAMRFSNRKLDSIKDNYPISKDKVIVEDLDFDKLKSLGEKQGTENITNNIYFIEDNYFLRNIGENISNFEGKYKNDNYHQDSPEFTDYQLMIKLIEELHLNAMVQIIPMNSKWYDFAGYDLLNRKRLYSKIGTIVKNEKSKKITVKDYSLREDEPYFLRDTNNLGWKGWVYINEDILRFADKIKK